MHFEVNKRRAILLFVVAAAIFLAPNSKCSPTRESETVLAAFHHASGEYSMESVGQLLGPANIDVSDGVLVRLFTLTDQSDLVIISADGHHVSWAFHFPGPGGFPETAYRCSAPPAGLDLNKEFNRAEWTKDRRDVAILQQAIDGANDVTLYAIDPAKDGRAPPGPAVIDMGEKAGRWPIVDSRSLKDHGDISALASAFSKAVSENREFGLSMCFSPHHAIRFKRGNDAVTLLVCFECEVSELSGFAERPYGFHFTKSVQPTWDAIFLKAGLVPNSRQQRATTDSK
jgi:hypothetical protein